MSIYIAYQYCAKCHIIVTMTTEPNNLTNHQSNIWTTTAAILTTISWLLFFAFSINMSRICSLPLSVCCQSRFDVTGWCQNCTYSKMANECRCRLRIQFGTYFLSSFLSTSKLGFRVLSFFVFGFCWISSFNMCIELGLRFFLNWNWMEKQINEWKLIMDESITLVFCLVEWVNENAQNKKTEWENCDFWVFYLSTNNNGLHSTCFFFFCFDTQTVLTSLKKYFFNVKKKSNLKFKKIMKIFFAFVTFFYHHLSFASFN